MQGLVQLGWRADAVQLQGRWESEAVRRYTRGAALHAPSELAAVVMSLCGITPAEVPPPPPAEPEPPAPAREDWVLNSRTGMYHLASPTEGRARCGWLFSHTGIRGGEPPPPWYFVTCKQCAPALRRRLKDEAQEAALELRAQADQ